MRKFYLALIAVCMHLGAFSQTDFPIGTGTSGNSGTSYPCPLQDYYEGSRMQYLYRASELLAAGMTAGPITAIKFNVIDTPNTTGRPELVEQMQISIDGTTDSSLDIATWTSVNNTVYGPIDYKISKGLNIFVFSTPYMWNGTDNIIIQVCGGDPNNAAANYTAWSGNPVIPWTTNLSFNGSHSYRDDNLGNLCGATTTTESGTPTTRPNIIFDTASCQPPNDLQVSAITTTGAMISWTTPASNPSQYVWEVRTSGAPGSGSTGLVTGGTSATPDATLTTLSPATTYMFYVRSNCGSLSSWSGAATFVTECVAVTALNENFDGVAAPALPVCWSSIIRATGGATPSVANSTGAFTAPNAVALNNITAALSDDIILVTPPLSNAGAGTYQLTFYARNTDATQDVEVGTLDNNTSTAIFTPLETVDLGMTYQKYTVSFANYSGTDMYIGIRRASTTLAIYTTVYIDNIVWEPIPACNEPTGLVHSNIDTGSAQLDWMPPLSSSPINYHIYHSTSNTPPTASTTPYDSIQNTPFTLTGLNPATEYFVWVRSNCGGGSVSSWTLADSFYTACLATNVPYMEDFELATIPNMPPCTSEQNTGTGSDWTTSSAPGYGFSSTTLTYGYNANAADAWFYTQGLNLTAGTSYRLTFRYGNNVTTNWSEKLEVKYGASPDNSSMTDLIVDYPNIQTGTAVNSSTDFIPTATGVYYLGFHAYSIPNQFDLYVDDIAVTLSPTCDAPTLLIHSNVDSTSAQLDWTAPTIGSPVGYHIYYSTGNTPPNSSTVPADTSTGTTYVLGGLSPATLYFVWVRSDCGSGGVSGWSYADSLYTTCSANPSYVPYSENFESATVPGMPLCTSSQNAGLGSDWITEIVNAYGFNSKVLNYSYDFANPANAWFFTHPVYLSAGTSYRLTFRYGNNDNTFYSEKLEAKYGSAADYTTMNDLVVALDSISLAGSAISVTDFIPAASGIFYFGFHAYSAPNQDQLYMDDIQITETPAVPITLSSFTGHREGSVNLLSWTTASEANNAGFELLRSADGRTFSKIAFAATNAIGGNSSQPLSYGYTDAKPFAGTSYYRLKQMDKDGRYTFSNIVAIKGSRAGELVLSGVYPNPSSGKLNVALNAPANDKVVFVLTDLVGKVVMSHSRQLVSGDNSITLDISSLPSGSYMLKVVCRNGCETAVIKVVRQ